MPAFSIHSPELGACLGRAGYLKKKKDPQVPTALEDMRALPAWWQVSGSETQT